MRQRLAIFLSILVLSSCAHLMNTRSTEKAKLYLQRGVDLYQERQYSKAIEATQESLKQDPSFAAAYNHLALIFMEIKRYDKADEAFHRALALQPDYPEVMNNLGVLKNREEKFAEAIDYLEKAVRNDKYPTPENAYTNLGFSYYRLGNITRAKAYHQKALDLSPQFCLAAKNMGDVYAKEKNYSKASEYFQQAVTHCPLYQESQYKLGLVLMKMGQKNYAKNHLEKLIERHKSGPYVERSSELLKFLQ